MSTSRRRGRWTFLETVFALWIVVVHGIAVVGLSVVLSDSGHLCLKEMAERPLRMASAIIFIPSLVLFVIWGLPGLLSREGR